MKIGILGAMEPEVESLYKKLSDSKVEKIGEQTFYCGKLGDKDVVVSKCGIGKVNAALCAQKMISHYGITHLINTGIAGAMGKGLGIFDFVVSDHTVYHDVDVTAFGYGLGQLPGLNLEFKADSEMISKAVEAFNNSELSKNHKMMTGRIASGDQFISGGERKQFIKETFSPMCVEMEGCSVAQAAVLNNIPFVIVRCMSDMADDNVESVYSFNEEDAAKVSSEFTIKFVENL